MHPFQQNQSILKNYLHNLPKTMGPFPPLVQRALTFFNLHLFESQLTVSRAKEECSIQSKSFATRFRLHLGRYPKEYILHHRLEAGKHILLQTASPVTTIALSVGFNSLAAFDNSFKNRHGLTPTQWREQN